MLTLLIGAALFVTSVVEAQPEVTPVLDTPNGPVFGAKRTLNGEFYEEYLGIPFAAPPVGDLRWAKPQPAEPWTEPLNATQYSIHCTQFIAVFYSFLGYGGKSGEDCLYMNVWVPGGVENNLDRKRPVMIWIYGGAYVFGMGEMYPGHALALHGDMIVVNFNYRVSALGFLSTGDSELPGNYGLWDQNEAFKWVQENIAAFGGDPNQVTIFGQSAGGASVGHAVASPHSAGLFHNAIAISGAATAYFSLSYQSLETAMVVGDLFDCNAHSTGELVTCLRQQEARALDFYSVVLSMLETRKIMNVVPVVDGDYLPVHPKQLYQQGAGKDVNLFIGSTYHDAAGFVILNPVASPALGDRLNFAKTNESMQAFVHLTMGGVDNVDDAFAQIVSMYPDLYNPDLDTRTQAMVRAFTDWWFGSSTNWEGRQHSLSGGTGKTYQYQFRYRQSFLVGYAEFITGSHLDDVYSVLGEPFFEVFREKALKQNFSDTDRAVSSTIMDYYSNIAHTGNPNEGPFTPPVEWTAYTEAEQNFLQESEQFQMDSFYTANAVDRYRFWTDDFPGLLEFPAPPTFPPAGDEASERWETVRRNHKRLTEEEIQAGLTKVKSLIKSKTPDYLLWKQIEKQIDELAALRNSKVQTP